MDEVIIKKEKFSDFLNKLQDAYELFGPVRQGDMVNFVSIRDTADIDLSFQNSHLSPKSMFLPQFEQMFEYNLDPAMNDANILKEAPKDYPPRALIGIRPCDASAFKLVDVNFDTQEYLDPWWVQAREATTLVGLACTAPRSTCFCTSVGGGPFEETGLDVLLVDTSDAFLAKVLTNKGKKLFDAAKTATLSQTFTPCARHRPRPGLDEQQPDCGMSHQGGLEGGGQGRGEELIQRATALRKEAESKIVSRVNISRLAKLDTLSLYEADFWEQVQFACINCGVCTYFCPTCWCFDIQDETYGRVGHRIRNWDSCMFPLFTLHTSGHNPRREKIQRVRQRFMHKLKYYVDKYKNGVACVGCGRCILHCPVNIDIRQVCELMNEYDNT